MIRYSILTIAVCASAFAVTPKELTSSDWSSIRSEYQRHRQAAFVAEGGWQALNYTQDWSIHFDGRGFEIRPQQGAWRWGLRLVSYGYAGQQRQVSMARAVADVERFSYQWDSTLREWYVNGAGLEHGYTLKSRPGSGAGLRLYLDVVGTLEGRVAKDGKGVSFFERGGAVAVLVYGGLKVTDAAGRELAARFYGEEGGLRLEIDDRGAKYPLTVDPTVQQAYLKASDTLQGDLFGQSVAASGDTVVVGSKRAAYVFTHSGGVWTQQAYWGCSCYSVAVSGDTIVVGGSGEVYVYTRSGVVWTQQAYLQASNAEPGDKFGDKFGDSVAVSGDTVVVGAPGEGSKTTGVNGNQADNSAPNSGAVYVFTRSAGVWAQLAYLKASNTGQSDAFGWSVAVSGDTVAVGAPGEGSNAAGINGNQADNGAPNSGAAYVFTRSGVAWTQRAYLKASNAEQGDGFGGTVAVSGDTIVVGAAGESSRATGVNGNQADNSARNAGAAYVFTRFGGVWSQQAYLKPSHMSFYGGDQFGSSVGVSGDTIVVGAWLESSSSLGVNSTPNEGAYQAGAAYVFVRWGMSWSEEAYLKPAAVGGTQQGNEFGVSAGVSGDTVVVGARAEDSSTTGVNSTPNVGAFISHFDAGAAYVFVVPLRVPTNKDQCKDGGWQWLGRADGSLFKNQGDCIQYVNAGK